jgi:hypothetical protein
MVDIFNAYGLVSKHYNLEEKKRIEESLSRKRTYPFVKKILEGDRDAKAVLSCASEVGMFIPPNYRFGEHAFQYFLRNIRYYDRIPVPLDRPGRVSETLDPLTEAISEHPEEKLAQIPDEQLITFAKTLGKTGWTHRSRKELISGIIELVRNQGHFEFLTNERDLYEKGKRVIKFSDRRTVKFLTIRELEDILQEESPMIDRQTPITSYALSQLTGLVRRQRNRQSEKARVFVNRLHDVLLKRTSPC